MRQLTFGSLFAGIGGFDLGLERAGMICKWQVEIDLFCQGVLAKRWPSVKRYGDIRGCGKQNLEAVDLICGGFPCQDISYAGKGAGIEKETRSGLWFEFNRIICDLRPRYVVVENVLALLRRGMGTILGGLASSGYDAEWQVVSACAFGAPHTRKRVFIVAYPAGNRREGNMRETILQTTHDLSLEALGTWHGSGNPFEDVEKLLGTPGTCRLPDGVPSTLAVRPALRCYGNAVVPQVAEWIGSRIIEFDRRNYE